MRKPYMNSRNGRVEIPLELAPEEVYDRGRRLLGLNKIRASNYVGDERKAELQMMENARLVIEKDREIDGFYNAFLKTWVSKPGFRLDPQGKKAIMTFPKDYSFTFSPKEKKHIAKALDGYPAEAGLPESREILDNFAGDYKA